MFLQCLSYIVISAQRFFFEFVDESSYSGALWKQIRKSKISSQCLHPLLRYGNFLFFGFFNNATLLSNQLFSNFTCLKLRMGRTQNCWNFCYISTRSRVIRERRIFIFNSVLTVYSLFSTFLHLKIYQKLQNKDRTVQFFSPES